MGIPGSRGQPSDQSQDMSNTSSPSANGSQTDEEQEHSQQGRRDLGQLQKELAAVLEDLEAERTRAAREREELEELKSQISTLLERAEKAVQRVESVEEGFAKEQDALGQHAANQIDKVTEAQIQELHDLTDAFLRPLENVRQAMKDDLEEGISELADLVDEVVRTHKSVSQAAGQLKHTATNLDERSEAVHSQTETFAEHIDTLDASAQRVQTASETLSRANLNDSLDLLAKRSEEFHAQLEAETEAVLNRAIQQVDNRIRNVINRFESVRKKMAKKVESVDDHILQRLNEMGQIRDAFLEYEEEAREYDRIIKELASKKFSTRELFVMGAVVFASTTAAGIFLDLVGVL